MTGRCFLSVIIVISLFFSRSWAEPVMVTTGLFADIAYYPQGSIPAEVVALEDATLAARITSWVKTIHAAVGQRVQAGDTLISLDCRKPQAALLQARADKDANAARIQLAEYRAKRAQSLRDKNHTSEEALVTRQSELDALRAEGRSLRARMTDRQIDVEQCLVAAPFDGVIERRMVDMGEAVSLGQELIRLVNPEKNEISATITAQSVAQINDVDQYVFVSGEQEFPLQLRTMIPVSDPVTRSREIRLTFSGRSASPGDSGRLIWSMKRRALTPDYLVKRGEKYGILLVENNIAVFMPVPQAQEGQPVFVDLADDARLIIKGRLMVEHDDALKIVN